VTDVGANRIILKRTSDRKYGVWVDSTGSDQGRGVRSCENGNNHRERKRREISRSDELVLRPVKKHSALCSYIQPTLNAQHLKANIAVPVERVCAEQVPSATNTVRQLVSTSYSDHNENKLLKITREKLTW
jgi:hypothetical protein